MVKPVRSNKDEGTFMRTLHSLDLIPSEVLKESIGRFGVGFVLFDYETP